MRRAGGALGSMLLVFSLACGDGVRLSGDSQQPGKAAREQGVRLTRDPDELRPAGSEPSPADDVGANDEAALTLESWIGPVIWSHLIPRIAASSRGEVYVSDSRRVYRVVDGVPEVFLSELDLDAASQSSVGSFSVDPDGNVHVVTTYPARVNVFDPEGRRVGTMNLYRSAGHIAAAGRDSAYVGMAFKGVVEATSSSLTTVYDQSELAVGAPSVLPDLRFARNHLYYLLGCRSCSVYSGPADGSGLYVLGDENPIVEQLGIDDSARFAGIAPHSEDGVIANLEHALVHLRDDGSFRQIVTAPSLDELATDGFSFTGAPERGLSFEAAPIALDRANLYLLARRNGARNRIFIVRGGAKVGRSRSDYQPAPPGHGRRAARLPKPDLVQELDIDYETCDGGNEVCRFVFLDERWEHVGDNGSLLLRTRNEHADRPENPLFSFRLERDAVVHVYFNHSFDGVRGRCDYPAWADEGWERGSEGVSLVLRGSQTGNARFSNRRKRFNAGEIVPLGPNTPRNCTHGLRPLMYFLWIHDRGRR